MEKMTNNIVKEIKNKSISLPIKPREDKKKSLKKTENLDKYFMEEFDEIYSFLKKELTKIIFELNTREIKINISNFDDVYENGLFKDLNECALKIKKKNNLIVVNAIGQSTKEMLDRCKISFSENLFIYEDGEVVLKKKPVKKTDAKRKGTTMDLIIPALSEGSNINKTKNCHFVFYNNRKMKSVMDLNFKTNIHFVSRNPLKNQLDNVNYVSIDEDDKTFTSFINILSK